jgi:lauroyl/myristoyl acyltransferase
VNAVGLIPARVVINDIYYAAMERFPRAAAPIGRTVARGLMVSVPPWRRALRANARLALGPSATQQEVHRVAAQMLSNMQLAIADVLHSQHATPEALAGRVTRFSGQDAYFTARVQCPGMIVASAHMGSFEPCLAMLRKFEPRVHVLYQPDPMPRFERARARLRKSLGVVEHRADEGVAAWAALHEALMANEVVVLHADRTMPFQRGSRMHFLGSPRAVLPTGPVRLALACGSAVVPSFCYRHADGLEVEMSQPIVCRPQAVRAAEVADHPAQRALNAAMERAIRAHAEQWMVFAPIEEAA